MKTRPFPRWFAKAFSFALLSFALAKSASLAAATFDAAPFGLPLPEGNGVMWEDPREIHRVVVRFAGAPPAPDQVRLEYWGSRWPEKHLPKDLEPGGGSFGWFELGNWYTYKWRVADTEAKVEGSQLTFTFHRVNAKEFPKVKDYAAEFRFTFKLRVTADTPLPRVEKLEAFTDSVVEDRAVRLAFAKSPGAGIEITAFNGRVEKVEKLSPAKFRIQLHAGVNSDPNTFDRTLVTVRNGTQIFTFKFDDLAQGHYLFLPDLGAVVLPACDSRDDAAVAAEVKARGAKTLYDRVAEMPEQTWRAAWDGMPVKKS